MGVALTQGLKDVDQWLFFTNNPYINRWNFHIFHSVEHMSYATNNKRRKTEQVQDRCKEPILNVSSMQCRPDSDDDKDTSNMGGREAKRSSDLIRTPPGWQLASSLPHSSMIYYSVSQLTFFSSKRRQI